MEGLADTTPTAETEVETEPALARRTGDDVVFLLVRRIAPLLGVDPAGIRVERGGGPAARPSTIVVGHGPAPDRDVVAHELAHVAQHLNRAAPGAARPDVTAAEREAAGLGLAARAGAPLWRPAAALPSGHVARLDDASGVTPDTSPAAPSITQLAASLTELVGTTRAAEIGRMRAELEDYSTWSWDAIETCLQILEIYDFVTARALAQALAPAARVRLVHFLDEHHKRHPAAVAAALAALTRADMARFVAESETAPTSTDGYPVDRPKLEDALHGIQADGLTPEAVRGLLDALRLVPKSTLVKLTRGDRREAFRELLGRPAPVGDDRVALLAAIEREQRVERAAADAIAAQLVTRLQSILTSDDAAPVRLALDTLAPLATEVGPPADVPPPAPDAAAARTPETPATPAATGSAGSGRPVATGTNAPPTPSERLRAVVAHLDAAGLVDRLVDGLPAGERYDRGNGRAKTLERVLEARAPALTLRRIESLLSYAWNDWAVTDDDARLAYLLVRTLPLAEQDAWRLREGGKWYTRLLDNLPDGMVESGDYTGVGSEFVTGPPGEKGVNAAEVDRLLKTVIDQWHANHAEINARFVARKLLGLLPDSATPLESSGKDKPVRIAVVRRLDALEELRSVYAHLPEPYLFGEQTRQEVLDLTAMRDPVLVELHAASLLSTGVLDWWISSREAWTAYQLVRSLPLERQQRFAADDPARWSAMLGALTQEMKKSLATGATTGRGPWPGRRDLEDRLRDRTLWDPGGSRASELRALCVLARVSDDAAFVFEQSRIHEAYKSPALKPMVTALELYDPDAVPPRVAYRPEQIEARSWGVELFRFVDQGHAVEWALVALGSWLVMDWVSIGGRSIHVSDFDLGWAQWANGGDLGGAVLADRPRTGPRAPQASPWSGQTQPSGPNRLSAEIDLGTGAVRLRMSELALDRVNIVRGGSSYRTGPVSVKNVQVEADFSDRHYTKPVGMKLKTSGVDVDDFVAANASLPGGAWALSHLGVRPLTLEGGAIGTEDLSAEVPREGHTVPIPVFSYLFDALSNIVAIKGGIPFDYTLVDFALIPFTQGMNVVASEAISLSANALFPTPKPLDYLWGLATDGVLRPPRSVGERVKDAAEMLRSFNVHFDELRVDGLTMGAGTQVSSIVLRDVDLGVGLSRPAYLRQQLHSLERAEKAMADGPDREATRKRIAEVKLELEGTEKTPGLQALEHELETLERKDRWEPGSLSAHERARLAELSDLLRRDAGALLDIGSISVGRISGAVQAEGGTVRGIHLEGRLPLAPRGYYADEDLVARFVAGGRPAPTIASLAATSDVHLTIASTELIRGPGNTPTLRVLAHKVPTAADLDARLKALPPTADPALRRRLVDALPVVKHLEDLQRRKDAGSEAVQQEISETTQRARELLGVTVDTLTLGPISGGLDPDGALTATVHGIDARGIAGDGFAIRRVTGDLTLGVGGLGGLDLDPAALLSAEGKDKARKALTGRFGLDARIEGIRTEIGDVGEVTIAGLAGDVSMLADGYAVRRLRATRLAAGGLNLGVAGARITARGAAVEGLDADAEVHLAADGKLTRASVPRLDVERIVADSLVYDSTDAATGEGVRAEIVSGALVDVRARDLSFAEDADGTRHLRAAGSIGAVDDIRYKVLLATLDSASGALKTTSVTGTVAGGAAGTSPVLAAAYAADGKERKITLDVAALRLLGTEVRTPDGTVVVRRLTVGAHVTDSGKEGQTFDGTVGDVEVGRIRWRIGTARVSGDGAITLRSVHASGSRKPSGELLVDEVEIQGIDASDLRYVDGPVDVRLGRFGKPHPGALRIGRVHLSGLVFDQEGKRASSAHVDIVGSHLDVQAVGAGFRASGQIDAAAIAIDLYRGDSFAVRLRGVGADVSVDMDGLHGHVILDGLGADSISVGPDAMKVAGLHIDQLSLDRLKVVNDSPPHRLRLETDPEGTIDVLGIDFTMRLDRWRPGETHPPDQPFKKVVVERFEIQRIQAEGLTLDLPDDGVRIELPIAYAAAPGKPLPEMATLHHILLEGEKPGTGFEYVPGKAGHLSGVAHLDSAAIPKLRADVKDTFKGAISLNTDTASIGFVSRGGTVIDVKNPRAALTDAATLASPDQTITVSELGAESVHVEGGKAQVKEAHLDKLRYEQPGVVVEIARISAPGVIEAAKKGGKIPLLQIDDAHITIRFAALRGGGTSGPAPPPFVLGHKVLADLLDGLQGDLSLNVLVKIVDLPAWLDNRDLNAPVDLHFTDGKLDYQRLQSGLNKGVTMKMADEEHEGSPKLGRFVARSLEFWMDDSKTLALGLHLADMPAGGPDDVSTETVPVLKSLVRWNLESGEIADVSKGQLRLFRAINPEKSGGGGGGSGPVVVDTLELRNILGNLSVRSKTKIPIDFTRGPMKGVVNLAPDAIIGLKVSGGISGDVRPASRWSDTEPTGLSAVSLDAVNIEDTRIELGTGPEITTGSIVITKLKDGHVGFNRHTPVDFEATIEKAVAKDIVWKL